MRVSNLISVSAALLLGGMTLVSCAGASSPWDDAVIQSDANKPPPAGLFDNSSPRVEHSGNFHLVTDQDRSKITWTARAGRTDYTGQVALVFGGLYLEDPKDLDGASGSISGNLRYIETGKPMWDREISEVFFESLKPGKESANGMVERIRLEPAARPGAPRQGEVHVNIGFAGGALQVRLPIEAVQTEETWRVRSLKSCSLDLEALGYGQRLQALAAALGVDEISPLVIFDFEVHLHPRSPHETARTPP